MKSAVPLASAPQRHIFKNARDPALIRSAQRILAIKCLDYGREIIGAGVHLIAIARQARTARRRQSCARTRVILF